MIPQWCDFSAMEDFSNTFEIFTVNLKIQFKEDYLKPPFYFLNKTLTKPLLFVKRTILEQMKYYFS